MSKDEILEGWENEELSQAIDWNNVQDPLDKVVWDRLTENFWLPERVPLSNDLQTWRTLTDEEKLMTSRVFVGLTLLDTIQGRFGATSLLSDANTPHEEAVLSNIAFMEAFSGETMLLTKKGWKRIDSLIEGEEVAQFNPETHEITFVIPNIIEPHIAEKTYLIESKDKSVRHIVSPGHRIYYEESKDGDYAPRKIEAKDFFPRNLPSSRMRVTGISGIQGDPILSDKEKAEIALFFNEGKVPEYLSEKSDRYSEMLEILDKDIINQPKSIREIIDLSKLSYVKALSVISEMKYWSGETFISPTKEDVLHLVAIASLAGVKSKISYNSDFNYYQINIYEDSVFIGMEDIEKKELESQKVYCVQVPTEHLLTLNAGEDSEIETSPVISLNCVHAKSYSSIFSTLLSSKEIEEVFRWSRENEFLKKKQAIVKKFYRGDDPGKKKIVSVLLESFLFYSGFYAPFYWASKGKLTNTADLIRLILRDEAVHGAYIGGKFQQYYKNESPERQQELKDFAYEALEVLYSNEENYTDYLYLDLGLSQDVKAFLRYNGNKALANLGFEAKYPQHECRVSASILTSLDPSANETHDFFSGAGASYVMGESKRVEITDEAWSSITSETDFDDDI